MDLLDLPDNPLLGESSVTIGGEKFRLVLDVPAFIYAQQATGKRMMELVAAFERDDFVVLRCLLWAGLQAHHPMTIEEAQAKIVTAGPAKVYAALTVALSQALGLKDEDAEDGDSPNPPKKKRTRGTG